MTRKKNGRERKNHLRVIGDITGSKPAERALQELEEEWRSLVENIPDIVMTLDRDGTILFVNRTVPGLTVERVIGTTVYDYVPPEHHDTVRRPLQRVFETGEAHHYEIAGAGPFGRTSWYFSRIGPIVRDGRVVAAMAIVADITERKRAEEALRESEEHFRSLIENASDMISVHDADGTRRFASPSFEQVLGYKPQELIGKRAIDLVHPDDLASAVDGLAGALRNPGATHSAEFRLRHKNGSWRTVQSVGKIFVDDSGVARFVVNSRDITERKRTEEALRESEERYRDLVENLNDIIYEVDASGRVTYISPVVEEVGGYSSSEIVGRSWMEFVHPDDHATAIEDFRRNVSGDIEPHERRLVSKSGEVFWVRSFGRPILDGERVVGMRGVLTIITERKLAEEALRESEERYRHLVENINEAIYQLDTAGRITYISPVVEEVGGYNPSEIIGRPFADFVHPDDLAAARENFRRNLSGRPRPNEYRLLSKAGEVIWVRSFGRAIHEGDRIVGLRGVLTDITERKRAEEALRASEERYRDLVENVNDVIYETDADGRITYISPVAQEVIAYSPSEIIGRPFSDFVHPDDLPAVMESFQKGLAGNPEPIEYRLLSKSGETRWLRSFSRPIFQGDRVVGFRGVETDITERKRAEEGLRQSEERYRDLVELSPYAMVVHIREKMVFVNSAGVQLFGAAAAEDIIGKAIWDFVHPDYVKTVRKRIQRAWRRGRKVDLVEEKLVRLDGRVIDVEMAAIPITYRGKVARQVVIRDISARKRMEEALLRAREEVESSVERRMQRGSAYGLTFREFTVLHLVAEGRSDREIGSVLGISPLTVQKHLENVRAKMKASSRTEASVRAIREGLLEGRAPGLRAARTAWNTQNSVLTDGLP